MHFCFVITRSDEIGGAHIHVRDMASKLLKLNFEVSAVIGGNGLFTRELKRCGVRVNVLKHLVREVRFAEDLKAIFEIRKVLRGLSPDLISIHSAKAGVLARLAVLNIHLPAIFTAHGWSFTEGMSSSKRRLYLFLERVVAPRANQIICVSEYDRELALRVKLCRPEKFVAIHNGMPDIDKSTQMANPLKEPPRFLMIARFDDQKDHNLLLKALAKVKGVYLTLVGGGGGLPKAKAVVSALRIEDRVKFVGRISNPAEILAEHQVYVLTSKWEGLPRSIIEAMRAGLPVIASDVGGCCEMIQDGVNGFLVPRGDLDTLILRLSSLASSPDLRLKMGSVGRWRYETSFRFDIMFEKTIAVYEHVLGSTLAIR